MATREISVRELRSLNAADLRLLSADDEVFITNRGERIARIEAVESNSKAQQLAALVDRMPKKDVGTLDLMMQSRTASIDAEHEAP